MQVVFTKIMYYWALSLWTTDKLNKQRGLRRRTADLSSQSTLTDRPGAQPKCVGCRDLYWKSFSHLFPQGFCPSTTDAPQTLTRLRLQQLSGCLDTFDAKGIERPWECTLPYKCITKSISGIRAFRHLLSNLQHLFIDGSLREQGMLVLFVKKANITESARYFNLIFLPEGIQYSFPSLFWHFTLSEVRQQVWWTSVERQNVAVKRQDSTCTVA